MATNAATDPPKSGWQRLLHKKNPYHKVMKLMGVKRKKHAKPSEAAETTETPQTSSAASSHLSTPKLLPLEAVYDGGLTSSFAALAPKPLEARIKRKSAPNGLVAAVQEAPVSYSENYSAQPVAETTSQAARHRHAKLDALVAKLEHERQLVKEDLMRYR